MGNFTNMITSEPSSTKRQEIPRRSTEGLTEPCKTKANIYIYIYTYIYIYLCIIICNYIYTRIILEIQYVHIYIYIYIYTFRVVKYSMYRYAIAVYNIS